MHNLDLKINDKYVYNIFDLFRHMSSINDPHIEGFTLRGPICTVVNICTIIWITYYICTAVHR